MKIVNVVTVFALAATLMCSAQPFAVTKVAGGDKSPGAKVTLVISSSAQAPRIPDLHVSVYPHLRTRVCAAKANESKLAIVLQYDEFYLQYEEFDLKDAQWVKSKSLKVCALNGFRSLKLRAVRIPDFGSVKVDFSDEINTAPVNWNSELLNKQEIGAGKEKGYRGESYKVEIGVSGKEIFAEQ